MPLSNMTDELAPLEQLPTAGRGAIRFSLLAAEGVEAGRSKFQSLVTDIVAVIHSNVREIRATHGDWGIDTFVGQLDGGSVHVWQSKFFIDGVGESQKTQIRESFKSLMDKAAQQGFSVSSWTLAIPVSLDATVTVWWEGWKQRTSRTFGIEIQLLTDVDLRALLMKPDFEHVSDQYFGSMPGRPGRERSIVQLDDPTRYDNALFVRQLHAADIVDDETARQAFFNAEVMVRDIHEREAERERGELTSVKAHLHQLWHTRYEDHRTQPSAVGGKLPRLYPDVCQAIEAYHRSSPNRVLRDSVVHRTGLVHHLAEEGRVGWIVEYRRLAQS